MDRLARDLPHTLKHTAPAAITGNMTLTITNSAGTAVVTDAVATLESGTTYTYVLTSANTATMDKYEVTWNYTISGQTYKPRSYFEIVGGYYCTVAELRAFDKGLPASYTDQQIINARENAEETLEYNCGVAFVPKGKRVTLSGLGTTELDLRAYPIRRVVSATVGNTALTTTELDALKIHNYGFVYNEVGWTYGTRNVTVYLEHGYDQPPEDVKRAVMVLVRHYLIPTNLSDRATSHTDDAGTTQFVIPGEKRPTGIPYVDSVIARYNERLPAIA